jgi:Holliday junction resolvase RusA-like endonuclease
MTTAARVDAPWQGEPYQRSVPVLTFALLGLPAPQGSKDFKGFSRSGRAIMVESSKKLKPWRASVHGAMRAAIAAAGTGMPGGFPLLGPIAVDLVFTVAKPKSAPKMRRTWPIVYPDVDKLARAALDEGKRSGLFGDDSQVVDLHAWKVYPLETPRALRAPGLAAAVYLIDEARPPAGEQATLL